MLALVAQLEVRESVVPRELVTVVDLHAVRDRPIGLLPHPRRLAGRTVRSRLGGGVVEVASSRALLVDPAPDLTQALPDSQILGSDVLAGRATAVITREDLVVRRASEDDALVGLDLDQLSDHLGHRRLTN